MLYSINYNMILREIWDLVTPKTDGKAPSLRG